MAAGRAGADFRGSAAVRVWKALAMRGLRGLYLVVGLIMAGVGSVFALLAELEHRYGLPTASLGWIAGSAFVAALVTQLTLALNGYLAP